MTVGVSRPLAFLTPIIGNLFGALAVRVHPATAPVVLAATADGGGGGGAGGGGGGGNPPPADALATNADFTFSELDWNKGVDFDAGDAARTRRPARPTISPGGESGLWRWQPRNPRQLLRSHLISRTSGRRTSTARRVGSTR